MSRALKDKMGKYDLTGKHLAKFYRVCRASISHILTRRNWKHL